MKIMFNLKPPAGSYGGGAFFVIDLERYFKKMGFEVTYQLEDNIDLIFVIDPRFGDYKKYSFDTLCFYNKQNPKCKLLYAVNECDIKRQVSINIEPIIVKAITKCDYVVFISEWLKEYYYKKYSQLREKICNSKVIFNACDLNIFYSDKNRIPINKRLLDDSLPVQSKKIKIVTHHWSNNYFKGFHIYNQIDKLLTEDERFKNIEFTYIGRYQDNYKVKNIRYLPPISGKELADELKKHDIYLTASLYEPGGIHQLEGMAVGLPVLYRHNSGGIQESVLSAGEKFYEIDDMIEKLNKIINNYDLYCNNIKFDSISADRFGEEYYNLICNIFNLDIKYENTIRNVVSIHQGGISNRFKSFSSAARIAKQNNCDYKLVWEVLDDYSTKNHILNCEFDKLFLNECNVDYKDIDDIKDKTYKSDRLYINSNDNIPQQFNTFNSNCGIRFICKNKDNKDIDYMYMKIPEHIRAEYGLYFNLLKPIPEIESKINDFSINFNQNTISVHIRSWNRNAELGRRSGLFQIDKFEKEMKNRINSNQQTNFYLASDSSQVINHFRELNNRPESPFYQRIITYPRTTTLDNSRNFPEGIQEDLIELYLLSKNQSIIGSHFSTYTEVSWWLAGCPEDIIIL
jgi:hypothetical protein